MHRAATLALVALSLACRNEPRPAVRPERNTLRDASPDVRQVDAPDVVAEVPPTHDVVTPPDAAPTAALPPSPTGPDGPLEEPWDADPTMLRPTSTAPLPEVPDTMRDDVRRYRALVVRTMECWSEGGRVSHTPPGDCAQRYATLAAGGPAAMHAIGRFVIDDTGHRLPLRERHAMETTARSWEGGPTRGDGNSLNTAGALAAVFARFESPEVVPYVIAGMRMPVARQYGDWGVDGQIATWLDVLPRVTGWDVAPMPPWQAETMTPDVRITFLGDVHDAWARWYRAHRNERLDAWRAAGLANARTMLTARDVARRVAAILRLGAEGNTAEDRESARRSLVELLAQRRMSNDGRRYMRQWATARGWTLDAPDAGADGGRAP